MPEGVRPPPQDRSRVALSIHVRPRGEGRMWVHVTPKVLPSPPSPSPPRGKAIEVSDPRSPERQRGNFAGNRWKRQCHSRPCTVPVLVPKAGGAREPQGFAARGQNRGPRSSLTSPRGRLGNHRRRRPGTLSHGPRAPDGPSAGCLCGLVGVCLIWLSCPSGEADFLSLVSLTCHTPVACWWLQALES